MKLAFSTNAFRKFSLSEAMSTIADAGYTGIEIMCDTPHAFPSDLTHDDIDKIRDELEHHQLTVSNMNGFMMVAIDDFHHPSWIESDPRKRKVRAQHTCDCLRMAKLLGALTVSTEPGGPLETMQRGAALTLFRDAIEPALEIAAETGIRLLIEPEPGLLIERSSEILAFLDELNHPSLGLNFDIGHFYCVGEDPAELIRLFNTRIDHIHLDDIPTNRNHVHLLPGQGAIDFGSVFAALREIEYGGWITVELYPYLDDPGKAARDAMIFLRKFVNDE